MFALRPLHSHPLYWALRELLGLTRREIAKRAELNQPILSRAARGLGLRTDHVASLRDALVTAMAEAVDTHGSHDVSDGDWRFHLDHVSAIVATVLRDYGRATFQQSDVVLKLTQILEMYPRGITPTHARDLMKPHSRQAVTRAFYKIGGIDRLVGSPPKRLWFAPTARLPPRTPSRSRPLRRAAKALLAFVEQSTVDGVPGAAYASDAIDRLSPHFSRTSLYRASRDLGLRRVSTGFGAAKRAVWKLPSPTVTVDFTGVR